MTVPPPHPDDVFAAALDALSSALTRAHDERAAIDDVVIASQLVYVAGIKQVTDAVLRIALQVQPATLTRNDQELHDLNNKVQQVMEATLQMRENRMAIEKVYAQLQELAAQVKAEIVARERLGKHVEELRERIVGGQ